MRSPRPGFITKVTVVGCLSALLIGGSATGGKGTPTGEAKALLSSVASAQTPDTFQGQPITMKVVNIPLRDFFRIISEVSDLNVLIDPDVRGSVTLNMEAVPWDQLFDAVLRSNRLDSTIEGNLVRISTKETRRVEEEAKREIKRAEFQAADTRTDLISLDYATAADVAQTLKEQLTGRGRIDVDVRTNTLIVTDVRENFNILADLVERLDVPERQVEIEDRIVEATTNFAREIGSQFNIELGNLTTRNVGAGTTTGLNADIADGGGIVGLSLGSLLDTFRLDAFISAAESRGEARVLSKPRVSAQNNVEAIITQGAKIPIPVTQNFTTRVRFEEAALKLTVTPHITDVGTVTLKLKVENDVPDFSQTVLGIPTILTSRAESLVLVPDGGTTVIGGIFTETDRHEVRKVPGLGDVPVLGHLFKKNNTERETREILFFLTVRIK